jgi:Ca2+-binding EF-hand superfamily protein
MEITLCDLLVAEIKLLRRLESLKQDLQLRYDYTNYAAFRTVDRFNDGFIDLFNLKQFFRNNNGFLTERELTSIIRRIDTDGDAKISYSEYSDFMRLSSPLSKPFDTDNYRREFSESKRDRLDAYNSSPLKHENKRRPQSASKYTSKHVQFDDMRTPVKGEKPSDASAGNSNYNTAEKSMRSSAYKSPIKQEIEDETVRTLKEHLNLEKEVESAKVNLAMKPDFNLFDAFKVFDTQSVGYLTVSDLKLGLSDIGVFATYDEVDLFFKRYDKDRDGKLRFSEFCDAIVPNDAYYGSMLNRRGSSGLNISRYAPRNEIFSYSTRLDFKELFRTHIKVEAASKHTRQRLNQRPLFNVSEAFNTCDLNEDGIVTKNEVKNLIQSRGFYVNEKDVSNLMRKFDKDQDGRISYSEFMDEFIPKSPSKAF